MKKVFLLTCLFISSVMAYAQTVDDVMKKFIASAGSAADIEKIKTVTLTGTLTIQGMDLPLTQQIIAGRGVKTNVPVMGTEVVMAYLDGKGWKVNQFAGAPDPTPMDAGELESMKQQVSVISPLYDSKKNGDKLSLAGEETVNGEKAWKLQSVSGAGKTTTYFISSTTGDILKTKGTQNMNGQDMDVETAYGDYKVAGGLRLPYSMTNSVGGEVFQSIKVDKYEMNTAVDEKSFSIPK